MPLGVGGDHSVADRGQSDLGPFALGIEAFSTSWRCVSCCRVRRNARRMSTLAVVRLATSSSLSKAREPSPRASLKALPPA